MGFVGGQNDHLGSLFQADYDVTLRPAAMKSNLSTRCAAETEPGDQLLPNGAEAPNCENTTEVEKKAFSCIFGGCFMHNHGRLTRETRSTTAVRPAASGAVTRTPAKPARRGRHDDTIERQTPFPNGISRWAMRLYASP